MVNIINQTIFNGIAGARPTTKPKYYILHNDAGSMSAENYIGFLTRRYNNGQSALGFAHYYIDRYSIVRVEDTYNGAWSCANYNANMFSLGYEVCQQFSTSDAEFMANEDVVLMQMAADMTYYGDTPNEDNIRFHNEFSSTSCPSRSLELHGGTNDSLREYVINKIKQYQAKGKTVDEMLANREAGWKQNHAGWWYEYEDGSYPTSKWAKIDENWYYFNENGYMLENQWLKHTDGNWYYLLPNGYMAKGWALIGDKWYYFHEGGNMTTGWVKYKDVWYYLDSANGDMKSSTFIKGAGGWYYLKEDGSMATGAEFTVEPDGLITTK